MYTKISKRKQGSPCKNFHQRCFETTNFDRLHREELLAQYLNKTNILTCIFKHLNSNKVPRAKILIQNVLKRQILTDFTANI